MTISNHPVEQEELMAYLDGELPPDRAVEAASHLEHCRECQNVAAGFQEVSQMLAQWQGEEAGSEITEQLAEALDKKGRKTLDAPGTRREVRLRFPVGRVLLWAGGLAIVVVLALAVFVPSQLRSRMAANDSSAQSLARTEATRRTLSQSNAEDSIAGYASFSKVPRPAPTPKPGVGSVGKLQGIESADLDQIEEEGETSGVPTANGPMIVRTAELEVTTKEFDKARSSVEEILKRRHGYVGELNVNTPTGSARSLTGTLRVPANQLDATLADIKDLGRIEKESQGGEEVTQQYVDLQARLANAKHTEQRLIDIQRERTGKLSDVLAVEVQISRVRGEIEQMEAQRKSMKNQVDFATLTLTVAEEYRANIEAVPPSTGRQFRNAAVEGYRSLVDGIIAVLLWLLSVGPTLLLWVAILFFPARMIWRRLRPRFAPKAHEV